MTKPTKKKTPKSGYVQDAYDKGFLKLIQHLQNLGYCKNVLQLEKAIKIPKGTLYQVKGGLRGIPLLKRDLITRFFVDRYDINPRVFTHHNEPYFQHDPPKIGPNAEDYAREVKSTNQLTSGDLNEISKLKADNAALREKLSDRDRMIKLLEKEQLRLHKLIEKMMPGKPRKKSV